MARFMDQIFTSEGIVDKMLAISLAVRKNERQLLRDLSLADDVCKPYIEEELRRTQELIAKIEEETPRLIADAPKIEAEHGRIAALLERHSPTAH